MISVMNMRRILCVFLVVLCLCGCHQKDEFERKYESMQTETFQTKSQYFSTKLKVVEIGENLYRYQVVINEPTVNIDNIKAFVVCDHIVGETIPSIGFYDEDKINLYLDKIDTGKGYYEGISLMGIANDDEIVCKLYIAFNVEDNKIEEYIELRSE